MKTSALRTNLIVALAIWLVGLSFAFYIDHAWEDYWITFRISRNLATGNGPVYTLGERLHSFTSPLGMLLPAGICWLLDNRSDEQTLWCFRLVSIAALSAAAVLLYRALQPLLKHRISCFLTMALFCLDAKAVDFSSNGMETGLLLFFLALTIHALLVPGRRRALRLGVGWGGLMWTRPDSCVHIAVLGVGAFLFLRERTGEEAAPTAEEARWQWAKTFARAAMIGAAIYVPWFAWAWSYYGSPVPFTIIAKGTNLPHHTFFGMLEDIFLLPINLLLDKASLKWTFLPANAHQGGWPDALVAIGLGLGLIAAFAWLFSSVRPQARLFSLAYLFGNFYLSTVVIHYFPWYLPAISTYGYITLGLLFDQALGPATSLPAGEPNSRRIWSLALRSLGIVLVAGEAVLTVCVAQQLHVQQAVIETGLRRQIGLWLRDHARTPHDTVMLEPLGYVGYFSGLRFFDYPGLSSREMVEVRRRLGPERENLAFLELKPDWIVLRPGEFKTGCIVDSDRLVELYDRVAVFDASEKLRAISWLPGRGYCELDQTWLVFHRKSAEMQSNTRERSEAIRR